MLIDSTRPDSYVLDVPVSVYTSVVIPGQGRVPSVLNQSSPMLVVPEPGTLGLLLILGVLSSLLRRPARRTRSSMRPYGVFF